VSAIADSGVGGALTLLIKACIFEVKRSHSCNNDAIAIREMSGPGADCKID
jgi:hypothetical protein